MLGWSNDLTKTFLWLGENQFKRFKIYFLFYIRLREVLFGYHKKEENRSNRKCCQNIHFVQCPQDIKYDLPTASEIMRPYNKTLIKNVYGKLKISSWSLKRMFVYIYILNYKRLCPCVREWVSNIITQLSHWLSELNI